jgi:hypothetical protein
MARGEQSSSRSPCQNAAPLGQFYFGDWSQLLKLDSQAGTNWTGLWAYRRMVHGSGGVSVQTSSVNLPKNFSTAGRCVPFQRSAGKVFFLLRKVVSVRDSIPGPLFESQSV